MTAVPGSIEHARVKELDKFCNRAYFLTKFRINGRLKNGSMYPKSHSGFWQEGFRCAGIHTALRRQNALITACEPKFIGENVADSMAKNMQHVFIL